MSILSFPDEAIRDAVTKSLLDDEMKLLVSQYEIAIMNARKELPFAIVTGTCTFNPTTGRGETNHKKSIALLLAVDRIRVALGEFTIIQIADKPTDEDGKTKYEALVKTNADKFAEKSTGPKATLRIKEGSTPTTFLPYGQIVIKPSDGKKPVVIEVSSFQGDASNFTPFDGEGIPVYELYHGFPWIHQEIQNRFRYENIKTPEMVLQFIKLLASVQIHVSKGSVEMTDDVMKTLMSFPSNVRDTITQNLQVQEKVTTIRHDGADGTRMTETSVQVVLPSLEGDAMTNFFFAIGDHMFKHNNEGRPGDVKQAAGQIPLADGKYFSDKQISGHEAYDPSAPDMGLPKDANGKVDLKRCSIGALAMAYAHTYMLSTNQRRLEKQAALWLLARRAEGDEPGVCVVQAERGNFKGIFEETWGSGVQEGYYLPPGSIEIINPKTPCPAYYAHAWMLSSLFTSLQSIEGTAVGDSAKSFLVSESLIEPKEFCNVVDLTKYNADEPFSCVNTDQRYSVMLKLRNCIQDKFDILASLYTPGNKRQKSSPPSDSGDKV